MSGTESSIAIMFHYVYILKSLKKQGWRYIGSTSNLKQRVEEHNRKENVSTKPYAPFQLIFYEAYLHKADAIRRERYLKTNKGAQVVRQMLKEYLHQDSRNINRTSST